MTKVHRTISIEDLITTYPGAVKYLVRQDIPCLVCGEPVWGTLEEVAKESGKSDEEIEGMVHEMNVLVESENR